MGILGVASLRPSPGPVPGTIAAARAACDALLEELRACTQAAGRRVEPQELLDDFEHALRAHAAQQYADLQGTAPR